MDQMQADKHHRPPFKGRCYLTNCFGAGVSLEEEEDEKPKSISRSRSRSRSGSGWFCFSRLRSKKYPKRTVPVEYSSTDDQKMMMMINIHQIIAPNTKPATTIHQLPAKGHHDEIVTQPSEEEDDAGQVLIGKAKKTRSGKGNILLGNSKSMNHMQSPKFSTTSKHGASSSSSLRKCTSAKSSTSRLINQPATGSHFVGLSMAAVENSQPPVQPETVLTGVGDSEGVKDEKNKGSIDRVVGISFIMMVLLIMVVWGKIYAILCFSVWLYFYPFLIIIANNKKKNSGQQEYVGQTKNTKSFEMHTNHSLGFKKNVVFQGFLQRDHHII